MAGRNGQRALLEKSETVWRRARDIASRYGV